MKAAVLLECSRLEEFVGRPDQARATLRKAQQEAPTEWKLFLEAVLLEVRCNNVSGAMYVPLPLPLLFCLCVCMTEWLCCAVVARPSGRCVCTRAPGGCGRC